MKKIASCIAVVFTLGAAPALAADMATKAPPAYSARSVAYSWTGWYGGVNAGYSWGHSSVDVTQAADPNVPGFGLCI